MTTITGGTPDHDLLAPLGTDTDVVSCVDQLIGENARRDRSLWLILLAADAVQLPVAVSIGDVPATPDPDSAGSICSVIAQVLDDAAPGGSAVITLVPGDEVSWADSGLQWLTALRAAAATTGVHLRMFCVATRDRVWQLDSNRGESGGSS